MTAAVQQDDVACWNPFQCVEHRVELKRVVVGVVVTLFFTLSQKTPSVNWIEIEGSQLGPYSTDQMFHRARFDLITTWLDFTEDANITLAMFVNDELIKDSVLIRGTTLGEDISLIIDHPITLKAGDIAIFKYHTPKSTPGILRRINYHVTPTGPN